MISRALQTLGLGALLLAAGDAWGLPSVPADFTVVNMAPGSTFSYPVAIAFLPDGQMLVAEQPGRVWLVTNGVKRTSPLLALENEVLSGYDRGLIGLAVDPNFQSNRFIYLLYTVDPDTNGTDTNDDAFGRLTRFQLAAADPNQIVPGSRTILMGATWTQGSVETSTSHAVGGLRWGEDGSLLASIGDGAHFGYMDPGGYDAPAFGPGKTDPLEDIGAFRAQYLGSLCGKILRINPADGHGYPSNPYWDGNPASVRSRVWAYGVRNPYRFIVRPGTGSTDPAAGDPGTIYYGDVGWDSWEEITEVPSGGMNFGWPCFEGFRDQTLYQAATPARCGCTTLGTPGNPALATDPIAAWHHTIPDLSVPPGWVGQCITGGVFATRSVYPPLFRGGWFFGDYSANWMKVAVIGENGGLSEIRDFGVSMDGPVDIALDPISGDVVYVALKSHEVRRIRYLGTVGVPAPVAGRDWLSAAAPNPSRGRLTLTLDLASSAPVGFEVYDVTGRQVFRAPVREYPAGSSALSWDAASGIAPSGLYWARVRTPSSTWTRRFTLLR